MKFRAAAVALTATVALGLSGCADSEPAAEDVAFAQSMLPHHEQALYMADLALAPSAQASSEVQDLAERIRNAQDPEIEQMTQWMDEWGMPMDMSGMNHGAMMGDAMGPGMMTQGQLDDLAGLTGPAFDSQWLALMIEHHEGAIAMADDVARTTDDPEVAQLAADIIEAQRAEVAMMSDLRG